MKFSVLISVYFKEKPEYFKRAIESILTQTVRPTEIVIVKDGKLTQELDSLIDEFYKGNKELFKIVELEENIGLGKALRIGVNNCSEELIARMDTDDICIHNRFEKQLKFMMSNSNIDVVGSYIAEFQGDIENIIAIRKVPITYEEVKVKAKYRNPLNHVTVMFRKKAVIEVGNYKALLWSEDYYLWARMITNNKKIENLPEVLVYVRVGNEMFKRRGGFKYIQNEVKLQKEFLRMGFINYFIFAFNILIRGTVRLLPNFMRSFIYRKALRQKSNNKVHIDSSM